MHSTVYIVICIYEELDGLQFFASINGAEMDFLIFISYFSRISGWKGKNIKRFNV